MKAVFQAAVLKCVLVILMTQAGYSQASWPVSPEDADRHLIKKIDPAYPPGADAGKQTAIVLRITIDKTGQVTNVSDRTVPPPLLPAVRQAVGAAITAVKQWEYVPFSVNGQAVDAVTMVWLPLVPQKGELTPEEMKWRHFAFSAALMDEEQVFLYRGPEEALAFSPDGHTLAVANREKGLAVWDTQTGQLRFKQARTAYASALAFHPDNQLLAVVGQDNQTIRLWNVFSGKEIRVLHSPGFEIYSVSFTADGGAIAALSRDGALTTWETSTGSVRRSIQVGPVQEGVFAKHAELLATMVPVISRRIAVDREIKIWDVAAGSVLRTIHDGGLIALSPDGALLATAGWHWDKESKTTKNQLTVYDTSTGNKRREITIDDQHFEPGSLAFGPDGHWLAMGQKGVSSPGDVTVWDVESGQRIAHFASEGEGDKFVSFSADGQWLAYTTSTYAKEERVKLCNLAVQTHLPGGHTQLVARKGETNRIVSLDVAGKDGRVAYLTMDNILRVWDQGTNHLSLTLPGTGLVRGGEVILSPDGKLLSAMICRGEQECTPAVQLWNSETGEELHVFEMPPGGGVMLEHAFSPDGRMLALISGCRIVFFDVATARAVQTLITKDGKDACEPSLEDALTHIVFSPDRRHFLLHRMGSIQLWDLATGQKTAILAVPIEELKTVGKAVFSPDGRLIAAVHGNLNKTSVVIHDAATLRELRTVPQAGFFNLLAVDQEGHLLVSNGDHTIKVWDFKMEKLLRSFSLDLPATASSGKVSADGRWMTVASSGPEGDPTHGQVALFLWDLSAGRQISNMDPLPVRWLHSGETSADVK